MTFQNRVAPDRALAVAGAIHSSPVTAMEFAAWPFIAPDEIAAAVQVLQSGKVNYWTGDEGRQFEQEFAAFVGCNHAVAVANGTVALECTLRALKIGIGDEVVTTSRSFIASAGCAVSVGARPVLTDVDLSSQNFTAGAIRKVLTAKTKAIIAVHLAGWPCDMDSILALAREFDLKVVEDCAQALGAQYKGRAVGSMGDAAAFSFCQDKIMTTAGEGGMVTTNSPELWKTMWSLKDHGKAYDAVYHRQPGPGFRWLHESFGSNWRLTEVQSAIGRVALRKLPDWLRVRRKYAGMLSEQFAAIPGLRVTIPPDHIEHAYYKYYVFVRLESLLAGWTTARIIETIQGEGVPCFSGICSEIYLEKAFPPEWRPTSALPNAHQLGQTSLMFLVHPTLSVDHILATCAAVRRVMIEATGRGR